MKDKTMFKPSTSYTFVVDVLENTLNETDSINITSITNQNNPAVRDIFSKTLIIKGGVIGRQIYVNTTIDDLSQANYTVRSFVSNSTGKIGARVRLSIMLFEGDYTNKPIPQEVLEGMQSTFEDKLITQDMVDAGEELAENLGKYRVGVTVRGKNLFDGKLELGAL